MKEVEVEIILPELPDVPRAIEGLAEYLKLEPESLGMTSTFDRMVDTEDMALLSKEHSMRVRQKVTNVFKENQFRLTYKYPIMDHDQLFIRWEKKLKLVEQDYNYVLEVLSGLAVGLSNQELVTILEIRELAREANLGEKGSRVNVSVDHTSYFKPGAEEPGAEEIVFEIESHGVDDEVILSAAEWVKKELGGKIAAQPKYARGLRKLGQL